ncbi:Threonine--tRNA ligase [Candidatus Lokiarchaeum ossiferum]|uniref:threonine--tRNA ligase n=1 Tax=Candidatus Lokiarchaeum ossiferum TaxID=2951803 RepID=A0ABY6HNP2_9ARCH|nr:Threonine--tRNA ligase [Candidatus Lokiarchaeum sp. B-35]
MIHSNGASMKKRAPATSKPQEFEGTEIHLDGKVLVCFISVEDQDTFDIKIISKQATDEILKGINLIEEFPQDIAEKNKEVEKFNTGLKRAQEKGFRQSDNPRKLKELILDPSEYKVDRILVYPWAHLSNYLSQEKVASEVCPVIAKMLEDKGLEAHFSPFGWYKAFTLDCLGHEVAEMYRNIPLALLSTEVRAKSKVYIVNSDKSVDFFCDSSEEGKKNAKIPKHYSKDFRDFIKAEVLSTREKGKQEPAHIKMMQKFELADFEDASDAGNLRWYTKGVLMKNLIRDYTEQTVVNNGAIYVDTPVMYTVKNKKLTAQTARFPAKTYWVHSGNNRFLLRFASDFLLFNMFSQMHIRSEQLPIRFYEYEQYAFRREQAGELAGLRRLRTFTMPDMHSLCKDVPQAVEEFKKQFLMSNEVLNSFGLKSFIVIRTTEEFWEKHKDWIIDIMASQNQPGLIELWPERYYYFILKYERPVLSAQGHTACLCTNQIDVESAQDIIEQYGEKRQKYNISWHSKDGETDHPIILHNSPSGAVERVIWGLLESNARYEKDKVSGFKTWLSPVQVRVMAITDKEAEIAEKIMEQLNAENIRCDYDDRDEKIGKKIRSAEVEWIPYTVVIGSQEVENNTVSVRKRLVGEPLVEGKTNEQINDIPLPKLFEIIKQDLKGYPHRTLPIPFRKFSTRINFR